MNYTTAPMFMTGDARAANPMAGGARPEMVVNPTRAPIKVLPTEATMGMMPRYATGTNAGVDPNTWNPRVSPPSVPPNTWNPRSGGGGNTSGLPIKPIMPPGREAVPPNMRNVNPWQHGFFMPHPYPRFAEGTNGESLPPRPGISPEIEGPGITPPSGETWWDRLRRSWQGMGPALPTPSGPIPPMTPGTQPAPGTPGWQFGGGWFGSGWPPPTTAPPAAPPPAPVTPGTGGIPLAGRTSTSPWNIGFWNLSGGLQEDVYNALGAQTNTSPDAWREMANRYRLMGIGSNGRVGY